MSQLLVFIFQDFWHWLGFTILLLIGGMTITTIIETIFSSIFSTITRSIAYRSYVAMLREKSERNEGEE